MSRTGTRAKASVCRVASVGQVAGASECRRGCASLDHRELADRRGPARRFDVEDVQAGRHVQVVLGTQVPRHEAVERAVLAERLHQVAVHGVDADGGAAGPAVSPVVVNANVSPGSNGTLTLSRQTSPAVGGINAVPVGPVGSSATRQVKSAALLPAPAGRVMTSNDSPGADSVPSLLALPPVLVLSVKKKSRRVSPVSVTA